jgi:hypothetical protein
MIAISPLRFSATTFAGISPCGGTSTAWRSKNLTIPGLAVAQLVVDHVARGHTPGVEGPHGQLGARLTDRLGRDDPDGQAFLGQIRPVDMSRP